MRYLALDLGEKRMGLALSDPLRLIAQPLGFLLRKGDETDLTALKELSQKHGVGLMVVGLPRSLDGSLGREAEKAQQFAALLARELDIPVELWDERLSTVEATRRLRESGTKKMSKDALAAALILQGFLDRRRSP